MKCLSTIPSSKYYSICKKNHQKARENTTCSYFFHKHLMFFSPYPIPWEKKTRPVTRWLVSTTWCFAPDDLVRNDWIKPSSYRKTCWNSSFKAILCRYLKCCNSKGKSFWTMKWKHEPPLCPEGCCFACWSLTQSSFAFSPPLREGRCNLFAEDYKWFIVMD